MLLVKLLFVQRKSLLVPILWEEAVNMRMRLTSSALSAGFCRFLSINAECSFIFFALNFMNSLSGSSSPNGP